MMPTLYRDFPLYVDPAGRARNRYTLSMGRQVPGGQPGPNERARKTYDPRVFITSSAGRTVNLLEDLKKRKIAEAELYRLGTILSDLLLPDPIRARLLDSLNVVRATGQRLRLRLVINVDELKPLPWEYLYLQPPGARQPSLLGFLALQSDVSIVRHTEIDEPEPRVGQRERYRLVAALSAPSDQRAINVQADREAIGRLVVKVTGIGVVEPVWVEDATRKSLREALREQVDIFHFAGHGYFSSGKGQIVLNKEGEVTSDFYNGDLLAPLLNEARTKLAVLSACETGQVSGENPWTGVATALSLARVPAVVASQFLLEDRNASPLVEEIYRAVMSGGTIDEAVYNARQSILQQSGLENRDWGSLVLYVRVADGVIFPAVSAPDLTALSTLVEMQARSVSTSQVQPINISVYQAFGTVQNSQVTGVSAGSIGASQARGIQPTGAPPRIMPTLDEPFIGREDELIQAEDELRNGGKYYRYGALGVGKTSLLKYLYHRLAKEERFPHGWLWIDAQAMTPRTVQEWVASRLGVQDLSALANSANALREILAARSKLLIGLDDVRSSEVARAVLEAAADCTVILNSSKPLDLSGLATGLELEPLTLAEAEQLFITLTGRPQQAFTDEDRSYIERIYRMMGGLPLAMRLAALKHAEGEPLPLLTERLDVAASSLVAGDSPVAAVFATTYADLQGSSAARRLLARIASFPAMQAATEALRLDFPFSSLDFYTAKDKLVSLGLANPVGVHRLALHPLLGRMALTKEDVGVVQSEHRWAADWLLKYAQENQQNYDALSLEHWNLMGIFERLKKEEAYDKLFPLTSAMFNYLRVRGYWEEARQKFVSLLAAPHEAASDADRAGAHYNRAIIHTLQSALDLAQADLDIAGAIYRQQNNRVGQGLVLYRYAAISMSKGDLTPARQQLVQALELLGEAALVGDRVGAEERLASIIALQGDPDEARKHYQQALQLSQDQGDLEAQARVHFRLGQLNRRAAEIKDAETHYERAFELNEQLGNPREIAQLKMERGNLYYNRGKYIEAQEYFHDAEALFQKVKYKPGEAQALHGLGNVALSNNDLKAAEALYKEALAINEQIQDKSAAAKNRYQLGIIAQRSGRVAEAKAAYRATFDAAKKMKDLSLQAASLYQLGRVAFNAGDLQQAKSQAGKAFKLSRRVQDRLTEVSALTLLGLVRVHERDLMGARDAFASAHQAFSDLSAPQASSVKSLLDELEQLIAAGSVPQHKVAPDMIRIKGADRTIEGVRMDRIVEAVGDTIENTSNFDRIIDAVDMYGNLHSDRSIEVYSPPPPSPGRPGFDNLHFDRNIEGDSAGGSGSADDDG